jgi:transposase-like protein
MESTAMGIKFTQQMTVPQFEKLFPDDDACKQYLVARRWPKGICCPRCGNENVHPVTNRRFHWQCTNCVEKGGYRFSVLVGTIFENTNVPLKTWFKVIYLMLTSKKGISALQVHRIMGFGSYSTAHYMCHRIRAGLADPNFRKLMGIVEIDETYIGGKNRNRHWDKRTEGTGGEGKETVIGAAERILAHAPNARCPSSSVHHRARRHAQALNNRPYFPGRTKRTRGFF